MNIEGDNWVILDIPLAPCGFLSTVDITICSAYLANGLSNCHLLIVGVAQFLPFFPVIPQMFAQSVVCLVILSNRN